MTRLNRPDSLLTELRDIKRRLHALETAQRNAAGGGAGTTLAAQIVPGTRKEVDEPDASRGAAPDASPGAAPDAPPDGTARSQGSGDE